MPPNSNTPAPPSDEIDLGDLFRVLWKSKILIVVITVITTCIAAGYAFLSPPVYQATVHILPPTANDLAQYNLASQLTGNAISSAIGRDATAQGNTGIPPVTPEEVYTLFLRYLGSNTVREKFFEEHYLPAIKSTGPVASTQQAQKRLDTTLSIRLPRRPLTQNVAANVTLEHTDPELVARLANAYVDVAAQIAREDLLSQLASEVAIRQQSVDIQIATARQVAEKVRLNHIARLQEALAVAEDIGLESPADGSPLIAINTQDMNNQSSPTGDLLYLRGTKALRAELQLLVQQHNDDAYIAELPGLRTKKALLDSIDLNPRSLSVATIDREAIVPAFPVKPKKALILALGLIAGGMLGSFAVLVRYLLRRTQKVSG